MKHAYACGIDFGTTNSAIGIMGKGHETPCMIPIENDKITTPTALFFEDKKTQPLFGQRAVFHYINGTDGRFIRSIKRILGTELMDKFTLINEKPKKFDDLIRLFLGHLKTKAEQQIGEEITAAVIGRPVHFQDDDLAADDNAQNRLEMLAKNVGFKEVSFQYESIAAAFSHELLLQDEKLALVVDLGGGTSDFTIIRLGPKQAQKQNRKEDILSTSGIRIGGNDFDKALSLTTFMPEFGKGTSYGEKSLTCPAFLFSELSEWSKINFTYTQKNIQMVENIFNQSHAPDKIQRLLNLLEFEEAHRLLEVVERTKIDLTSNTQSKPIFESFKENIAFSANKKAFENSIADDVYKIEKSMKECLKQAKITPKDIDLVILTGGSCEIPFVQNTFKRVFPAAQFSEKEKMLSVGVGLTWAAKSYI